MAAVEEADSVIEEAVEASVVAVEVSAVVVVALWAVVEVSASSSLVAEVSWAAEAGSADSSLVVVVALAAALAVLLLVDSTVALLQLPLLPTPSPILQLLAASLDLSSTSAT